MDNSSTADAKPIKDKSESFVPRTTDGFIGRLCKIESKRGIIMCLTTVALAVLFIVLAIISKIGVMDYSWSVPMQSQDGSKTTVEYSEHYSVDMSIFNLIYLVFGGIYTPEYDEEGNEIEQETELDKKVNDIQAEAQKEYDEWLSNHQDESAEEQQRKRSEIFKKHYEEAGVVNSQKSLFFFDYINSNNLTGGHLVMMIVAILLFVATVAMTVIGAIVCVGISIIKMAKGKKTRVVLRMLMLIFIGSALTTVFLASSAMLAVSVGMLAIAILSGIMWLLLSNAFAFMYGKDSVATIIKLDIVAALLLISVFLSIAPTVSAIVTSGDKSIVYGGCIGITHVFDYINNAGEEKAKAVSQLTIVCLALIGLVSVFGFNATVRRLGYGEINCKNFISKLFTLRKSFIIEALVLFAMMIVCKFAFIDKIANGIESALSFGVCIYLSIAAAAIALILDFVFRPEKKVALVTSPADSENQN